MEIKTVEYEGFERITLGVPYGKLPESVKLVLRAARIRPKVVSVTLTTAPEVSATGNWRCRVSGMGDVVKIEDGYRMRDDGDHDPYMVLTYSKAVVKYGESCGKRYPAFASVEVAKLSPDLVNVVKSNEDLFIGVARELLRA